VNATLEWPARTDTSFTPAPRVDPQRHEGVSQLVKFEPVESCHVHGRLLAPEVGSAQGGSLRAGENKRVAVSRNVGLKVGLEAAHDRARQRYLAP
jgi:hypothetical protein